MIAALQRPETHIYIDSGASRSACPFGYAPDMSAKGTASTLFSIDGSPIDQRGCKRVNWEKRDSAGETKRIRSTMVESGVLCLVASVSSSEENKTLVVFCDYYLVRQPMPPSSQSQGVPHVKLQKQNGMYWLQADRRVTVDDKSSANALAGFSSVQIDGATRRWSCIVIRRGSGRVITGCCGGWKSLNKRPCRLNRDSRCEQLDQMSVQ